jgi:hypothetical protein
VKQRLLIIVLLLVGALGRIETMIATAAPNDDDENPLLPSKPKPKPTTPPPPAPPPAKPPAPPPKPPAPPVKAPEPKPEPKPAPKPEPNPEPAEPAKPEPAKPVGPKLAPGMRKAHDGFVDDMDCSACHTADSWKLSQTAGKSGFDHDKTGFVLRAAHLTTPCGGCHVSAAKPSSSCEGCHRDPHQGRMDGECYECHSSVAWSDVAQLEQHRRTRMPLTGAHAVVDCVACHKRNSERTYTDLPVDCYACHAKEYHSDLHPDHDGDPNNPAIKPLSRDCSQCHRTVAWKPAVIDPSTITPPALRAAQHDAWFQLSSGSHRAIECTGCHVDPRRQRMVRCDGCHADTELRSEHRTPVSSAATGCMRCHPRGARR